MRRRFVALAAGLLLGGQLLIVPGSAAGAGTDPGQIQAVVQLRTHADLTGVLGLPRRDRLAAVERLLRAHAGATQRGLLDQLAAGQRAGTVGAVQPLWISNSVAVRATRAMLAAIAARPEVASVRPEFTLAAPSVSAAPARATGTTAAATVEPNVALVNAPALWNLGYRGQSVVVANMDTGVDVSHPDLSASWRGGSNSWYDPNGQHPSTPTDLNGHGTQTMGVMVGGSAGGTAIGVAPAAKWIAVKIFDDRGSATSTAIHLGFQWLLDPDGNPATADAPNVVDDSWTMSAGGCDLSFQSDLRSLRSAGILPVFAAGNDGPTPGTVFSPANNPEAFAVGGTDNSDALYPYSSRGPSACTQSTAPALVAPAVGIRTTDLFGGYASDTGTSVAAPAVAGGLALLLSAFPGTPADRQQQALDHGAVDLPPAGVDPDTGYGRLDVLAAYQWLASTPDFTVAAAPGQLSIAAGGQASSTITVTAFGGYANPVTLSLAGLAAGQGSWQYSPATLGSGAGSSTLQVTVAAGLAPGSYPLTVQATDGVTSHTTPITLTVTAPPDFTLAVSPASATVIAGNTTGFTISSTARNGFTGTLSLSASGLPAGVGSGTFGTTSLAAGSSTQWTVSTAVTAPAGSYPITISAVSGSLSHSVQLTLTVSAQDFTLTLSPSSAKIPRGQTVSFTVTATPVNGFTGAVTLTGSGLPAGSSATLAPNPLAMGGTATWRIRTSTSATRTSYTIKLTGKWGGLTHQVTAILTLT